MVQEFSLRYPLIDGQGNFGSVDGDGAAALPLHRVPAAEDRRRDARRHRQGNGRFRPELRRQGDGALGAAVAAAESPHQRLVGHRRRDGDQHPAAQPDRGHQRVPRTPRQSGAHGRRIDRHRAGAGFPDGGDHLRARGRARGLSHRSRPRRDAGAHAHRGAREGQPAGDHRRRDPLPGEQGEPARADRRARPRKEARRHLGSARRVGQVRHARGHRAEARRDCRDRPQQSLQADAARRTASA